MSSVIMKSFVYLFFIVYCLFTHFLLITDYDNRSSASIYFFFESCEVNDNLLRNIPNIVLSVLYLI